jgi:hypothetical protein
MHSQSIEPPQSTSAAPLQSASSPYSTIGRKSLIGSAYSQPVPQRDSEGVPPAQYLGPEFVLEEMGEHGARRVIGLSFPQVILLAALGGGLITTGAIFSLLLGAAVDTPEPQRLLEGLGFSTGFFFVILVSAILFTEANVTMPSVMLACDSPAHDIARFWALAWIGPDRGRRNRRLSTPEPSPSAPPDPTTGSVVRSAPVATE